MLANIAYFAVLTPAEMLASKATAVVSETKDLKSVAEFSEPHSQIDKIRPNTQYDFSNNLAFIPGLKQWGCTFQLKMLVVSLSQNWQYFPNVEKLITFPK